eukprot:4792461-Prymnesium_polylepis.1
MIRGVRRTNANLSQTFPPCSTPCWAVRTGRRWTTCSRAPPRPRRRPPTAATGRSRCRARRRR